MGKTTMATRTPLLASIAAGLLACCANAATYSANNQTGSDFNPLANIAAYMKGDILRGAALAQNDNITDRSTT